MQREKLSQKQAEADRALNEITRSMAGAGEQKIEMEDLGINHVSINRQTISHYDINY